MEDGGREDGSSRDDDCVREGSVGGLGVDFDEGFVRGFDRFEQAGFLAQLLSSCSEEQLLAALSPQKQHRLKLVARLSHDTKRRKYPSVCRSRSAQGLPNTFTDDQVLEFLAMAQRRCSRAVVRCFLVSIFFGLRQSEFKNVQLLADQGMLKVYMPKSRCFKYLPVYGATAELFLDSVWEQARSLHKGGLRKEFGLVRSFLGGFFELEYDTSSDGRPLYQFSMHVWRHTGAARVARVGGPSAAQEFLGHKLEKSFGTTGHYLYNNINDKKRLYSESFCSLYLKVAEFI